MKAKFYRQFYIFAVYFFISLFAFGLRPKAIGDDIDDDVDQVGNGTRELNTNDTTNAPVELLNLHNLTGILCNFSAYGEAIMQTELGMMNATDLYDDSTMPMDDDGDDDGEWTSFSECPLLDISTLENRVWKDFRAQQLSSDCFFLFVDKTWRRRLTHHRRSLLHLISAARGSLSWSENVFRESGRRTTRPRSSTLICLLVTSRAPRHRVLCFCFPAG